ncbi:MAG: PrsW family intramembrane metalloprotease [Candidatus Altiarchaeota archaeon]
MDFIVNVIMVFLSFIVSSIPILLYIWFVWWLDHHDREPLVLIALAFFWGAVASIVISIVFELILSIPLFFFPEAFQKVANYVVLAPVTEEIVKSLILFILFFHRKFNRVLDGIVYGAVVGFGFAASENIIYYTSTYFTQGVGLWVIVVVLRTIFTSVGHAVWTSVTGAGVALMKFSRQKWMRFVFPPLAILTAVLLHSLFNLGAVLTEFYSIVFFVISTLVVFFGLVVIGVAISIALHDESTCIRTQLADELRNGVVTEEEYGLVHSYLRRRRASFRILAEYGYEKYRFANRLLDFELDLAFSKDEMDNSSSAKQRKELLKRVNGLRDSIKSMRKKLGESAKMLK